MLWENYIIETMSISMNRTASRRWVFCQLSFYLGSAKTLFSYDVPFIFFLISHTDEFFHNLSIFLSINCIWYRLLSSLNCKSENVKVNTLTRKQDLKKIMFYLDKDNYASCFEFLCNKLKRLLYIEIFLEKSRLYLRKKFYILRIYMEWGIIYRNMS